ncbi:Triacylglycerol lipase 2 [Linum perenne]
MAKALTFIIWALLCKFTVSSGRSFLSSINQTTTTALQPSLSDGICELMITSQGYTCEEHTVTTSDGYILSLQRIPVGYSGGSHGERTPVLLQHGVLMDGMTWLLLPPRQSLAFVLADHGYDVWIANSRGTKYSRGHTSLSTDEKGYWDWSWDELVKYDLPATVDYVHHQTGQNMHYIGHSQGTLTALAAFSKGQLMNRLRSATLLCPVAYLGQMSSFLAKIGADIFLGEDLYNFHLKEFDPKG